MKLLRVVLLFCGAAFAQQLSPTEQQALTQALGEAGTSAVELIRAIENHLAFYPGRVDAIEELS